MRIFLFSLLLLFLNSCNSENGVQKNYIISQTKEDVKHEDNN